MSMTYEECLTNSRPARPLPNVPSNVMEQFSMRGKTCIVTGASRGIGLAVAEGLAEAGAHVVLVYRSGDQSIRARADEIAQQNGVKVLPRQCDVTDPAKVQALVSDVRREMGRIDVFVANAGICYPQGILEQSLEDYHEQMNVNVHSVVYCAKSVGAVFKAQGFGNFIITGSMSGEVVTVPVDHTAYNTTKAAVTHLGKSLAREWREFARVNIVSPGWITTDMSTCTASVNEANRMAVLGRQGNVKELKAAYLYLASNASSFVTGTVLHVDGGYLLP
ncbi:uncharacterized protein PV07_04961 [Cladophialophora immunda]|uniref:Ketoreductase domain-containing protein n=1 Tax=Cladophialophora immunda TaxID=569365 RepID=A0A0D2CZZ8_9EURO|nr:uncharacterized protein PV07_04961 [Cladophialophora immunda]KIW29124.1 hypothetical protein PV07_04961 [Cladophialophora immunda]